VALYSLTAGGDRQASPSKLGPMGRCISDGPLGRAVFYSTSHRSPSGRHHPGVGTWVHAPLPIFIQSVVPICRAIHVCAGCGPDFPQVFSATPLFCWERVGGKWVLWAGRGFAIARWNLARRGGRGVETAGAELWEIRWVYARVLGRAMIWAYGPVSDCQRCRAALRGARDSTASRGTRGVVPNVALLSHPSRCSA